MAQGYVLCFWAISLSPVPSGAGPCILIWEACKSPVFQPGVTEASTAALNGKWFSTRNSGFWKPLKGWWGDGRPGKLCSGKRWVQGLDWISWVNLRRGLVSQVRSPLLVPALGPHFQVFPDRGSFSFFSASPSHFASQWWSHNWKHVDQGT